jgi:hypothetical protein
MRVVNAANRPAPLFLSQRCVASRAPIITLRADAPSWWEFGVVTVVHALDASLVGKQFPDLPNAMGALHTRGCVGERDRSLSHYAQLEACVRTHDREQKRLDPKDRRLGEPFGDWQHSPQLATTRVECFEQDEPNCVWLPATFLRPFAPHNLSETQVDEQMAELVHKVRRRPPARPPAPSRGLMRARAPWQRRSSTSHGSAGVH